MAQEYLNKILGLYTFESEIGSAPPGSFDLADDADIDINNIFSSRRGLENSDFTVGTSTDRIDDWFEYKDTRIVRYGSKYARLGASASTDYSGTFAIPTDAKAAQSTLANKNFYMTTNNGPYKLDDIDGSFRKSGAPQGIPPVLTLDASSAKTVLEVNDYVAYRTLCGYRDANDNLILGAVSDVTIIQNTTATKADIDVSITLPDEIDNTWFIQIYRSFASASSPDDELQLVYEVAPTATQVTAGAVTFNDSTPDSLLGALIYTAPSIGRGGIAQNNFRPPKCEDMDTWNGHTLYANTTSPQQQTFTLLATGSGALESGQHIFINSINYVAGVIEDASSNTFKVFNTGSPASDVEKTAESLVRVINAVNSSVASGVTATYASSSKLPGTIFVRGKTIEDSAFNILSDPDDMTNTGAPAGTFDPAIDDGLSSENDRFLNAIYFSKRNQPEAVPIVNDLRVGSANEPILRIKVERDFVFVFKTDGLFIVNGSSYRTARDKLLDATAKLVSPRSVQSLSGAVWAHCVQGIVECTESGVKVRSQPIKDQINELLPTPAALEDYAFSIAYESDKKYIYFTPAVAGSTVATQAFVWSIVNETWVRWVIEAPSGTVFDDKIHLGLNSINKFSTELKSGSFRDYTDGGDLISISNQVQGSADTTFEVSVISEWVADAVVTVDGESGFKWVRSINSTTKVVTIDGLLKDSLTNVRLWKPINVKIRWNPISFSNTGLLKQFQEFAITLRRPIIRTAEITVVTDRSRLVEPVIIKGDTGFGLFGNFPLGSLPFGGGEKSYVSVPGLIPRNKSIGIILQPGFNSSVAYSNFQIAALSIFYENVSERTGR